MSRHRHFTLTVSGHDTSFVDSIQCVYIAYALETGANGYKHLQGYVSFANALTLSAAIKKMKPHHVEVMLGSYDENEAYCSKSSVLIERGVKPMSNDNKGRAEHNRWKRNLDLAKAGKIDEIDADIQMRYFSTIEKLAAKHAPPAENLEDVCGLWIYGTSGCGKSRYVWKTYPGHYIKSRNKWWQGYRDQDTVCLDDIGHNDAKWMLDFLKDWADFKVFQAECKGTSMQIRPKLFIVTSQYSIDELWPDYESSKALNRRFKKLHMGSLQNVCVAK